MKAKERGDAGELSPLEFQRQRRIGVLARASIERLEALVTSLYPSELPIYDLLRAPETGLVMIQGRAGGDGQPFNVGEMTVTRCALRLREAGAVGFGYVAGRSTRHAELAALFDALGETERHGAAIEAHVVEPLIEDETARKRTVQAKAAETKVDFFTLVRGEDPIRA